MKVILQQDVANVGRKNELVEVANGFALNKLIPNGQAQVLTEESKQALAAREAKLQAATEFTDEQFASAVATLGDTPITLTLPASEQGQLFQALHADQIAEAAHATGAPVTATMIVVPETIKSVGTHTVKLVAGENEADLTVEVVAA